MSKRKLEESNVPEICDRNVALRIAVKSSPANSWRELDNVGAALLGLESSPISVEEALRIVDIWRLRQVEFPHAIESTISIAEILYKEARYTEQELQLLLAAVITRSVNGMADSLQQNRAVAASVAGLCARIGIPTWIVQLRHNATHQQLPPVATLRMGATSLLTFFDSTFWTPLRQNHEEMYHTILEQLNEFEVEVQKRRELQGAKNEQTTTTTETNETKTTDSSEEDDVTDADDPFDLKNSRLGSTRNQFALLQSVKRKKKPEEPKNEGKSKNKKKREKQIKQKMFTAMAANIAKDKSCSPDILFDVMLDFLVQGDCRLASFPHFYHALLHAMGCEWPGFLPRLLVECFKVPDEAKAVLLVRYLCSKRFVQLFEKEDSVIWENDLAPTNILLSKLQYPLNVLCDQAKPGSALHGLLVEILGADRVPHHGLFSEAMQEAHPDTKSVWKRCKYWEPWAFGSFPTD